MSNPAETLVEVEHGGASYQFAYRYKIFRPFRPERNGIYNIGIYTCFYLTIIRSLSSITNQQPAIEHIIDDVQYMYS